PVEAPVEAPVVAEAPVVEAAPEREVATPTPRPRVEAVTEVAADTLAAELALLRRARAAQSAGDAADALAALAEHRQRFPHGALSAEREGTSALLRCQSRPDPAVAASFARTYPSSPLLARVRGACTSDSE
ncbi:MAG: hypothetical protein KC586_04160, partial [Myxococcales bacterium]|nr:hypothetical protein [Myxococcales bacterium]